MNFTTTWHEPRLLSEHMHGNDQKRKRIPTLQRIQIIDCLVAFPDGLDCLLSAKNTQQATRREI